MSESDNIPFTTLYNFQYDHDLDYSNWGWSDFRDAWRQIAEDEDENYAWRVIYDLWRARAGEVDIAIISEYDEEGGVDE